MHAESAALSGHAQRPLVAKPRRCVERNTTRSQHLEAQVTGPTSCLVTVAAGETRKVVVELAPVNGGDMEGVCACGVPHIKRTCAIRAIRDKARKDGAPLLGTDTALSRCCSRYSV